MATKADVIACLIDTRGWVTETVESMPDASWSNPANDGWDARQLLYHIASTSGVAGFVLRMSALPSTPPGGEPFDNDEFNRSQVALREEKSPEDALNEIRANIQRDIEAVESASDADLQRMWTSPWGHADTVAKIIIDSLRGHIQPHLHELGCAK